MKERRDTQAPLRPPVPRRFGRRTFPAADTYRDSIERVAFEKRRHKPPGPNQAEKHASPAKRQAVCFEALRASNRKCSGRRPNPTAGRQTRPSGGKESPYRQERTYRPGKCLKQKKCSPSDGNLRIGEEAPSKGKCSPPVRAQAEKSPPAQRAGARRRSPQRGSAAAGAHITREAGRCAPTCPLRRAADKVHDMRQRRPPPHGTRGSTGVVGGVEGHAPLTPCRPPRKRPNPDAGQQPPSSGRKERKE